MTQVELVTRHAVRNYGSALQVIASSELLASKGTDVTVIDYRQPGHEDTGWALANQGAGLRLPRPARAVYGALRHLGARSTGRVFERALRNNLRLTDSVYRSFDELQSSSEFASTSLYCSGSDQVWNVNYNVDNRPYYLDFAPAGAVRFSLASSIGMDRLPEPEEARLVAALQKFKGVSVREAEAETYLRSLGIPAVQHVDPTLAVDPEFWRGFAQPTTEKSPYVLVYQLNASEDFTPIANAVASRLSLPVKRIEYWRGPRSFTHSSVVRPDIRRFVSLFMNAAFVVTDSFHGTVFSTTFARPYAVVSPPKYPGRILSLLSLTGQEHRVITTPGAAADLAGDSAPLQDSATLLKGERDRMSDYLDGVLGI